MRTAVAIWIPTLLITFSLSLFASENKPMLSLKKESTHEPSGQGFELKRKSDPNANPNGEAKLNSLRNQETAKPSMDLHLDPEAPESFRDKMDSLKLDGGIHGGGGGNSYCAELSDLYQSIQQESEAASESDTSLRCYPIHEQATVIDFFQNNLILDWQKWSMLSDQDKIWELTGVLLTRKNKMQPAPTEEVDAFVLKLIATSPVFTKYKFFESLSRNGNALTFEKPFIPVKGTHYRVGYEYWCWYAKPCSHYEYQPWLQPKNPDLLASNFCRLLGFRKMTQARWSEPFQHSIVPGLNPDSHSQTLADISSGVFNGTFQTHAYGQGYTAILETVTCER